MNLEDEIIRDTLVTRGGEVVNPRIREALDLEPLDPPEPAKEETTDQPQESQGEGSSA